MVSRLLTVICKESWKLSCSLWINAKYHVSIKKSDSKDKNIRARLIYHNLTLIKSDTALSIPDSEQDWDFSPFLSEVLADSTFYQESASAEILNKHKFLHLKQHP